MLCELKPKLRPLQKGGTIGVVAPAKPAGKENLTFCLDQLKKRGYRTKVAKNISASSGIFAGDERFRAEAFMECWCDPAVDAVWCFHGGYGCSPLLDHLDYERLKDTPKIFIGMSDITALHVALTKRCELVTFLGPTLGFLFAPYRLKHLPYSETWLWNCIANPKTEFLYPSETQLTTIQGGQAQGLLTGGNLALIAALMGTPWQLKTKGKILVLEDVNEPLYRIDRMLCQLRQGGLLTDVAAVLLCSWRGCLSQEEFSLQQVFERYFSEAPYPVLSDFPSGHIDQQVTLPLNCLASLDADCQRLTLMESPVG